MIILAIVTLTCWILAAICNATMDTLSFKYKKSIFKEWNPDFWNPSRSWRNKYKNGMEEDGAKFFGSTTFLVFITDGWHLFQFLCTSFIILGMICLVNAMEFYPWWVNLSIFVAMKISWGIAFELFFAKIFRTKK